MQIIFTEHVKDRMKKRNISEDEIIDAVNNPDKTVKIKGKY